MSDNHAHIKNLPAWKQARLDCFERDDYTCQCQGCNLHDGWCGATENLQADHDAVPLDVLFANGVTAEAIEQACDVDGLLTRCGSCNSSKGATTDAVVVRHTWINPRYASVLGWIEEAQLDGTITVFKDDAGRPPPSSVFPPN